MPPTTTEVDATEKAQELAKELGVELSDVKGTGADGKVTAGDVRKAASSASCAWATKGYDGPQPWEGDADQGPEINHSRATLTSGSAGPDVAELCELLRRLGYETSYSQGENPFAILAASELAAVERFRSDYGVQEDPSAFAAHEAANHVGPWTWEALNRAAAELD